MPLNEMINDQFASLCSPLEVSIDGFWNTEDQPTWQGHIIGPVPFVILSLLNVGTTTYWVKSPSDSSMRLWFTAHWLNWAATKIQILYWCGAAHNEHLDFEIDPSKMKPNIQIKALSSGRISKLIEFSSQPLASICLLLLSKQDVKIGRHRIWHLRNQELLGLFAEPLRTALTRGRQGHFENNKA
jgi:hypothetical protein